jgi:hypothetical protein
MVDAIFYSSERNEIIIYETKFDKEYSTQFFSEVCHLTEKGIRYTFVKKINGLITYKYEKTKELFEALTEFYSLGR